MYKKKLKSSSSCLRKCTDLGNFENLSGSYLKNLEVKAL